MANQARAKLTVCNGKQAGKVFPLTEQDRKIIGRDTACHIQILDKGISRNHSLIEWKGEHFLLVDLGSTNGTFVNNEIIISKPLQTGDVLKIGQTEIQFEETLPAAAASALIMDDLLEYSPHTIMERVDVSHSLSMSSSKIRSPQPAQDEEDMANIYLSTIYEVSNLVNAEHDIEKLFTIIMDKIMDVFKPDRGFLVIQENDEFRIVVNKNNSEGQAKYLRRF